MASGTDAPVDLYVAAYDDPDAARGDWDAIKDLAEDDVIKVDGLVLVSRRDDGKITVDDDFTKPARAPAGARSEARSSGYLPAGPARQRRSRRRYRSGRRGAGVARPRKRRSRPT